MVECERFFLWCLGGLSVAWILEYFSISGEGLIIMSSFLVLDLVFALLSAKARGEKIESDKCQKGLIRKLTRRVLPFLVAGALKWTGMENIDILTTAIMGVIIFSELYSIIGHIYAINFGEELPEMDAFKILLNKITERIKTLIKKETDKVWDKGSSPDNKENENKSDKK